ncbi:MAG: hypothetical protein R6W69_01000 [Anaerolineales bacterium]
MSLELLHYGGYECARLANDQVELLVTRSAGPRILSLRFLGGENLLAEQPNAVAQRPDGSLYHFIGGHRLWHAPEHMPRTYVLDDVPVDIQPLTDGLLVRQPAEVETGIQKTIQVALQADVPQITVTHTLTNQGLWPVECAAWAITQFKTGGLAILPQADAETGLLPNRSLVLWPYTDMSNPNVTWGRRHILIQSRMQSPFKIGYPNPHGWLAYWNMGVLFVKQAAYQPEARYYDFGSSSECYCNDQFLELETLGPTSLLEPGCTLTHVEHWALYSLENCPGSETEFELLRQKLALA